MSYEFESTSYELKSTSHKFESVRIIKPMKTQVNSLKSSPFAKIISPEWFGSSWGNLYVQFLVIISCFTFPLPHAYGFNFEKRDLNSPQKSHPSLLPPGFWRNLFFPLANRTDFSFISLTQNFVLYL